MSAAGGNHRLFRRWVDEVWRIPTEHFDPWLRATRKLKREPLPLEQVLVRDSTYSRRSLKARLYAEGLKRPECEMCGQGERWRGRRMALILDHINGVPNDNRIANLQILCPNCAATLATHCGRKNLREIPERSCLHCGESFRPNRNRQAYCSVACGTRHGNRRREPKPELRKVERPSYEQLRRDVAAMSMCAVGRKYGVSDNAVRKWLRAYERSGAAADGGETEAGAA